MKRFLILTVAFLLLGIFSINAQDLIVLRDGNIIEAKVMEISQTEIRYKRFEHLEGPTIVVPAANVLSIRYENGTSEIITSAPVPVSVQPNTQTQRTDNTAIDQNRFIFGINANAGGAIGYALASSGAGVNIELGKGRFNSEINLLFPRGGFGALITFNGFWPSKIGGFYLGGGFGYSFFKAYNRRDEFNIFDTLPVGLNIGYKFVTKSGLYFRTGAFTAFDFGYIMDRNIQQGFYFKPDLSIGWTMR